VRVITQHDDAVWHVRHRVEEARHELVRADQVGLAKSWRAAAGVSMDVDERSGRAIGALQPLTDRGAIDHGPDLVGLKSGDVLMKLVPVGDRRMSSPRSVRIQDRNSEWHDFVGEGFKTTFNTFLLLHAKGALNSAGLLLPASTLFPVSRA